MQNWAILCSTVVELFNSLPTTPVLRTFVQYLIGLFRSRPESASDVISGKFVGPIVPDSHIKLRDPCLNYSREIPSKAVGGGICDSFIAITSYQNRSR